MELIKKHLMTILCAVCILLLVLPLANVTTVTSSELIGETRAEASVNGFGALGMGVFGYILVIGPALLVAMNYIKQLDKYKSILAVVVPVICIVALILVLTQCDSISASASAGSANAKIEVSLAIGAYLLFVAYAGTAVAGAVTYHNLSFDKESLEKLKSGAANLVNSAQEKIGDMKFGHGEKAEDQAEPSEKPAKKNANLKQTEEVLALLERLAEMKARGILSEEEFAQKKTQLLEEI